MQLPPGSPGCPVPYNCLMTGLVQLPKPFTCLGPKVNPDHWAWLCTLRSSGRIFGYKGTEKVTSDLKWYQNTRGIRQLIWLFWSYSLHNQYTFYESRNDKDQIKRKIYILIYIFIYTYIYIYMYHLLSMYDCVVCRRHFMVSWNKPVNNINRKWQDYVYIQCEYKSTKQKIKHLLREENKVKENKISQNIMISQKLVYRHVVYTERAFGPIIDYNGASSSMKLLTTGVPQGSILGPRGQYSDPSCS